MFRKRIAIWVLIPMFAQTFIAVCAKDASSKGSQLSQATGDKRGVKAAPHMLSTQAKLTMEEAEKLALEKVPGKTEEIELSKEGKKNPIFEIEIAQEKRKAEVHVDAVTGAILKVEYETIKKVKLNK